MLQEIVAAVEGKVEVYLDGGVRKGTDILKALALGAKAVFVGRPVLWGLAYQVDWNSACTLNNITLGIGAMAKFLLFFCFLFLFQGEDGVKEVLNILKEEFKLAMALSGELRYSMS